VRTSALVTNLGVHFKLGRENALAWVTTLDKGQPVPGATVQVSDCNGKPLARATTDAQGVAELKGLSPTTGCIGGDDQKAYFAAPILPASPHRAARRRGGPGLHLERLAARHRALALQRAHQPDPAPDQRAHTVLDRTLLRAGETVSMKHLLRWKPRRALACRPEAWPATLVITHVGSGQQFTQPLAWRKTATGGLSASQQLCQVPPAAKLGVYQVELRAAGDQGRSSSGQFRVEEFRLPVFEGACHAQRQESAGAMCAVPAEVQVNYVAGGPAANLPVRVSALVRGKALSFPTTRPSAFSRPRASAKRGSSGEEEATASQDARVIADKLPLTLDRNGAGKLTIDPCRPRASRASCCWRPPTPTPMARCRRCAAPPRCGRPAWSPASRPRAGCRPASRSASRRWRWT
jgi:uncharacterized protein YfaS (alpha-2-macroglobulin family)